MKAIMKSQVRIVLVLWVVHVSVVVVTSVWEPLAWLVDWCGLGDFQSFSILLVSLLSVIAFLLNRRLGVEFAPERAATSW